jgi:hypothetical protein
LFDLQIGVKQSNGASTFELRTAKDADDTQYAPVFKRFLSRLYRLTPIEIANDR